MALIDIQGKKFDPVGRCIFCGSDGGADGLRTEHIIPFSLGGNAELPEASCLQCEKVTSYVDGYLARHVFHEFRIHANIQTRRPRQRPTSLPSTLIIDGEEDTRDLPISGRPLFLTLPHVDTPGVLAGRAMNAPFTYRSATFFDFPADLHQQLGIDPSIDMQARTTGQLSLNMLARACAKIAYCNWVAVRGLGAMRPIYIVDLILGRFPYPAYLFGGNLDDAPPPHQRSLHTIDFELYRVGRLKLLVAHLRLFARHGTEESGMPIYTIVLGAPRLQKRRPTETFLIKDRLYA